MGEIPGAFTQVFDFGDAINDEEDSDEEVEALRQGFAAVRFSKDFKQHIRIPWARALIVKVHGRMVGFSFSMQSYYLCGNQQGGWNVWD